MIETANSVSRQEAQAFACWYRSCFAFVLLALSSLATLGHLQDVRAELLVDMVISQQADKTQQHQDLSASTQELENKNTTTREETRLVYFLKTEQLSQKDGFSGSWLQTRSDFMDMPFDTIGICEDAAFRAYDKGRRKKMRMSLDWLDFGVEHMSKWWKMLEWDKKDPIPFQKITSQFTNYIQKDANMSQIQIDNTFQQTIAVIAFQAYKNDKDPSKAHDLSMKSLATTIESLRRAGFGRVTVSVLVEADFDIAQDAFYFLLQLLNPSKSYDSSKIVTQIGHMEVGFAVASPDYARTKVQKKNMPKATLLGLKDAFEYSEIAGSNRTTAMTKNMTAWLGNKKDPSYWKYVYLTEPDTILQARPTALPQIKVELDKGSVLLPHRLQPIPHESDVRGMEKENLYVSEREFPEVIGLDPNNGNDVCCDEHAGADFKPGLPPYHAKCKSFWYQCGFGRKMQDKENRHVRLKPYKFIRLLGGTGIVSLAGSEHGRRCIPRKDSICRPPGYA
ncbi:expressed unknown protein [Seminavis robusta]|uniref:Uncharacterized protein n=1 Tax=Seminavis robusta TaxID=568900 RepID=A0A9N8EGL0_9STRA|nr:expressed unknown protein [Seminavis robusta]|eukprot:Sro969_g226240.1 n/a (506) ;mRNA; r:26470-28075